MNPKQQQKNIPVASGVAIREGLSRRVLSGFTCKHEHGSCLPGAVVSEEGGDLAVVHVHVQIVDSSL